MAGIKAWKAVGVTEHRYKYLLCKNPSVDHKRQVKHFFNREARRKRSFMEKAYETRLDAERKSRLPDAGGHRVLEECYCVLII